MGCYVRTSLVLLAVFAGNLQSASADYISATLGSAGSSNYSVLALSGATDIALNGPGTTVGNVGISSGGNLQLNSSNGNPPVAIQGNVYLGNTATMSHPGQVTGTVFTNQDVRLGQANTDARNASTAFAKLAPTMAISGGAINANTIIYGVPGVNVINVSGINLGNGQKLTLHGPVGTQFIINDSGGFTLNSGRILLTGGLTPNDVVLNITGTGTLQTSGGLNNASLINGILLAPNASIAFAPGLVNGELIAGGQSIHLVSGASVNWCPSTDTTATAATVDTAPEPSSLVLALLGTLGVMVLRKRKH
jgi:hypothetical protein